MNGRVCQTELHTWTDDGRIVGVTMCRTEMHLSYEREPWVWGCRNERCGTAHVVSLTERDALESR